VFRGDDVAGTLPPGAGSRFRVRDVAGPGVVFEDFENFGLHGLNGLFGGGAIDAKKMVDEQRNVAVALASGGMMMGTDVDPEIEVFAESGLCGQSLRDLRWWR